MPLGKELQIKIWCNIMNGTIDKDKYTRAYNVPIKAQTQNKLSCPMMVKDAGISSKKQNDQDNALNLSSYRAATMCRVSKPDGGPSYNTPPLANTTDHILKMRHEIECDHVPLLFIFLNFLEALDGLSSLTGLFVLVLPVLVLSGCEDRESTCSIPLRRSSSTNAPLDAFVSAALLPFKGQSLHEYENLVKSYNVPTSLKSLSIIST